MELLQIKKDGCTPQSSIEAIKALKNKGIRIVAATGIRLLMCKGLQEGINRLFC